jgi:hypothetical protein
MQANLDFGKAAFRMRSVSLSVAILAAAPLIATLAICAPDRALAATCGASHPAGVHAAGGGGGVNAATSRPAASGGSGGGGGTLGCPGGSSASALQGLRTTSSGRVVETGVRTAHTASSARTATTRTANASVHTHAVKSPHHS